MAVETSLPQSASSFGFELEQGGAFSRFMLNSPLEILSVLKSLHRNGNKTTVYFDQGKAFFLTNILAVDEGAGTLTFDYPGDSKVAAKAIEAPRFIATSTQDRIKIQFLLNGLRSASLDGRPVLVARLPDSLLRLQRREYFRLELSLESPIHCRLAVTGADGGLRQLILPLQDISGGGVGIFCPQEHADLFVPGTLHPDCRIDLPDEPTVTATLCVKTATPAKTADSQDYVHLGCEFINLPANRLNAIQRFITRSERERKARMLAG